MENETNQHKSIESECHPAGSGRREIALKKFLTTGLPVLVCLLWLPTLSLAQNEEPTENEPGAESDTTIVVEESDLTERRIAGRQNEGAG